MRALAIVAILAGACACSAEAVGQPTTDELHDLPHLPTSGPIDIPLSELGRLNTGRFFKLDLGPMPPIVVARTSLVGSPTNFTWRGTIGTNGSVVITSRGGKAIGTIFTWTRTFRIVRRLGRLEIENVPPATSRLRERGPEPFRHGARPSKRSEAGPIRILVAYTKHAAAECRDIETVIEHAVELTNDIAENTRVSTRFELADTYETSYDDTKQGAETVLDAFSGTTDTQMNEVHDLRKQKHADIAILFVAPEGNRYDGLSAQTTASYDTAFSIVNCRTALDLFVMPHEIGHLLGLNDDDDQPDENVFKEGYGHFNKSAKPANCWRTVMATPDCTCCRTIPFWSNPSAHYPTPVDAATGVAGRSDNAYVIGQTAGAISRFEPRP